MTATTKDNTHQRGGLPVLARQILIAVAGTAVMTLAARIQIPFWPVPMTLQVLAVMTFAVTLGPRMATAIFATYLAAGVAGLPVFAGTPERGIGLAYMVGPTGGYLAGFLIASGLTGWLAQGRGMLGQTMAMLAGLAVTYAFGLIWLGQFVPMEKIVAVGMAPFLPGDLVKIALVALGARLIPGLIARLRSRIG